MYFNIIKIENRQLILIHSWTDKAHRYVMVTQEIQL